MYAVKLTIQDETKMRIFSEEDAQLAWAVFNRAWAKCKRQLVPYLLDLWEDDSLIKRVKWE